MAKAITAARVRHTLGVRRFVIDNMSVDDIADLPGAYEAVRDAVRAGSVEILWTHITVDELGIIDDVAKRLRLLSIAASLSRFVATGAAVLDYSRLDAARLTEDGEAIEAYRRGNVRYTRDALVAATAEVEHAAILTRDKILTNRARDRGVDVLTVAELLTQLPPA